MPDDAQQLMTWKIPTLARVVNGWSMNTDTMGVYGNYYLKRAIVAQVGLGANLPEDAIYPLNLGDEAGRPLDGANKYVIHFDKGATPPVNAFWSITLYDADGFQVGQWSQPLRRQQLDALQVQRGWIARSLLPERKSRARTRRRTGFLPRRAPFNLTMRLYARKSEALTGKWNPPPVTRVQGLPGLGAQ